MGSTNRLSTVDIVWKSFMHFVLFLIGFFVGFPRVLKSICIWDETTVNFADTLNCSIRYRIHQNNLNFFVFSLSLVTYHFIERETKKKTTTLYHLKSKVSSTKSCSIWGLTTSNISLSLSLSQFQDFPIFSPPFLCLSVPLSQPNMYIVYNILCLSACDLSQCVFLYIYFLYMPKDICNMYGYSICCYCRSRRRLRRHRCCCHRCYHHLYRKCV